MAPCIVCYYDAVMGQMLCVCVCLCVCVRLCVSVQWTRTGSASRSPVKSLDAPTVTALPTEAQGMTVTDENKVHTQLTCHLASVCEAKQGLHTSNFDRHSCLLFYGYFSLLHTLLVD